MNKTLLRELHNQHYVIYTKPETDYTEEQLAYFASYLLLEYGISVDKPNLLTEDIIKQINSLIPMQVPKSFYNNPQDTKYFNTNELLIEQVVSYFIIEIQGTHSEDTKFDRLEIYKKTLPEYKRGNDVKLRMFMILTEEEAVVKLKELYDSYCSYTRPFGFTEIELFETLYKEGYYTNSPIKCKDNIMSLLSLDINFAKQLDKKDVVKYSIRHFGEVHKDLKDHVAIDYNKDDFDIIKNILPLVQDCPMSKKQVKYFNKLCSLAGYEKKAVHNSPYKTATKLVKEGKVVEAAKVFAKSGSLLERNLKWLLSRANPKESLEILDLLHYDNPLLLIQLINKLVDDDERRDFIYYSNNKLVNHTETDYEYKWRKSRLNKSTIDMLRNDLLNKLYENYKSLPSLGNVYISEDFKKVAPQLNTSASGKGLDVLSLGSKVKIKKDYIRVFCYWKDVFDIDLSSAMYNENLKEIGELDWRSYNLKMFGDSALTSGDCRDKTGAEYQDFRLSELNAKGIRYVLVYINGYGGALNIGDIYCGYQNKSDLNTKAWDPKNIATQINVKGDSRLYYAFAIDTETKEMIILNQVIDSQQLVGSGNTIQGFSYVLNESFLDKINMYNIIASRSNLVSTPEEADIVFDDTYVSNTKTVVRTYNTEKLISYLK